MRKAKQHLTKALPMDTWVETCVDIVVKYFLELSKEGER
jgi:hypothetical protein